VKIRFVALGLAGVLLSSPAAADNLTISSKTTSPVSTAAAANNSPGDITIDANGSVEVSRSGYSVLLNSNNAVANSGTISNAGGSGAIGLEIVPGFTGSVNNSGTINVITTGTSPTTTGQFGILLMNGNNISFTGTAANAATSLTASSVVGVIMPGDLVSGATGFANGTYIVSQTSGTPGGTGVYVLSQPVTAALSNAALSATGASFQAIGSGTNLTVSSVTGLLATGDTLSGAGISPSTTIVSQVSGTPGGAGVYTTNQPTTVAGATLTAAPQIPPFNGDIVTTATSKITVAGFGANGIGILSELNGNLLQGGTITAQGATSSGIMTTAPIDRGFVNTGTIETALPTSVTIATSTSILSPGWATAIGGNVGGGILNAGPLNSADKTAAAVMSTFGASPALIVAPTVASDSSNITIGVVSDNNTPGYSIINRGNITSTAVQPGVSPVTVQIGNGASDTSGLTTTLTGGFYNSGTISAVATSDSAVPIQLPPSPSNATGMMIGVGATVPTLTNTATGTISAATSGSKGGTATALVIQGTGQIQSTASTLIGGSLQSLNNAGNITASAQTSDQTISGLGAFAIQDLGGALTSVTNSGTISATATQLNNNSQSTIAADLSANSQPVTFTNSGTVTGDLLFPNVAGNQLTIEGGNANVSGAIRATGLGTVNIGVSAGGTGGILHTSQIVNAGSLTVGPQGTLDIGVGTISQVVSATGPVSFAAGSHITVTPITILPTGTTIRLVHSDTSLTFANFAATTSTIQVPFLFTGNVSNDSNNLTLNLQRKTAAQLGLSGNAAEVYEPAIAAAVRDTQIGAALGTLGTSAAVQSALAQLLPVSSAADLAIAKGLSDPYINGIGARQRSLLLDTVPPAGFNPWFQGTYDLFSGSGADRFSNRGAGGTLGVDFTDPANGHFGIALSVQQISVTDKTPTAGTEAGSWYVVSPYMGFRSGNFFFDAQLNGGGAALSEARTVTIGSLTRVTNSAPSQELASGSLTGGFILDLGFIKLMPQATIDGLALFNHNYVEQNGGAGVNLTVGSHTQDQLSAFAGVGAGGSYDLFGVRFVPQLLAGWGHGILTAGGNTTAAFAAIPFSTFSLASSPLSQSEAVGGVSFDFVAGNISVGASYNAISSSALLEQSARLTFSARF
jgi:autotransporter-like protein